MGQQSPIGVVNEGGFRHREFVAPVSSQSALRPFGRRARVYVEHSATFSSRFETCITSAHTGQTGALSVMFSAGQSPYPVVRIEIVWK